MYAHHRYSVVNTLIHLYTSWSGTRHIRDIFTSVTIIFITMNTGKEEGKPQVTVSLILFYIRVLYGPRLIHSWLLSPHTLLLHRHCTYLCTVLLSLLYAMWRWYYKLYLVYSETPPQWYRVSGDSILCWVLILSFSKFLPPRRQYNRSPGDRVRQSVDPSN